MVFSDNAPLPKLITRRMARFINEDLAALVAETFKVIK